MPTTALLVQFLATLEINPQLAKVKTLEMDLRGRLNPTLWLNELFFGQNRWLGFRDFYQYYLRHNQAELQRTFAHQPWSAVQQGLEARLYRTQFGMLTEYHAYYLCRDFFGPDHVRRPPGLDLIGVDFQLQWGGQWYNLHIFVDTPRAWEFRRYKAQHKAGNQLAGRHVNLPYSLAREGRFNSLHFLPNGFGIYREAYLAYLQTELAAGRIGNDNIVGTTATGFVYRPPG
ncbi:MAG: TaqI family restriction endonuclease [Bernardetiaceae bacterium]|jgi:hypothetical protein|nr:TaqI family restriction endonuclease [Bernardetiaceae bacterium]